MLMPTIEPFESRDSGELPGRKMGLMISKLGEEIDLGGCDTSLLELVSTLEGCLFRLLFWSSLELVSPM